MSALVEDAIAPTRVNRAHAYRDLYDQGVTEASFLWLLRSIKLNQASIPFNALVELEARIDEELDGLMTALELGWEYCKSALISGEPGEQFTATVIALRSRDVRRIQTAVESGLAHPRATPGLISALGWLPAEIARPWIERLLKGKDMKHKYLGVAASSVRRDDPGELLSEILKREDCRNHVLLHARALRLIGELRRQDLMPALEVAFGSPEPSIVFWAHWSAILLGHAASVTHLRSRVLEGGPLRDRALQIVFRVLPLDVAREWISALAQVHENRRAVIAATGVLGDPHAVNWLITKMSDPALARLSGEAFTLITGIDLLRHELHQIPPPAVESVPNDDLADPQVGMDEDEGLPWPDPEKVAALWRQHGQHFLVGRRYFLGKPISPDWLRQTLREGSPRARHAAALELALIDSSARLVNTYAKVAS